MSDGRHEGVRLRGAATMALMGPTHDHGEIRAWASRHEVLPAELLPHHVNGEPVLLQLTLASQIAGRLDLRVITWEDFFARFDLLGLTVVYDDSVDGYNELLQRPENDADPDLDPAQRTFN